MPLDAAIPAHRAFVAGATGYTGRAVVRELRNRGIAVTAHVRPDSPRLDEWRERFSRLGASSDSTSWSPAEIRRTLLRLRPTLVFALLGTTRARAKRAGTGAKEAYMTVDFELTRMLIEASSAVQPPPRVVYLSSLGASEGSRSAYLLARVRAERTLRESGVPFTIARPSFITGADRDESRPLERAGAFVTDLGLAVAGALGMRSLRERYRSTTAPKLARSLVRLALDPSASNRAIEGAELH